MFNTVSDSSATLLQPDKYLLKVVGLEEAESTLYNNTQIKWIFQVATTDGKPMLDGNGKPVELWQFTTKNITSHPKNKTRPWLEALLNRKLKAGEQGGALADEVKGKKAQALIGQYTTEGGKVRNNVTSMFPLGATAPAAPTAEQHPFDPDQEVIEF